MNHSKGLHLVKPERPVLGAREAERWAAHFESEPPQRLLQWAFSRFGRENLALVASFQVESMVLIDMAAQLTSDFRVITIDTGRLPQETYDLIDEVRKRYRIPIEIVLPDSQQVQDLVREHGLNLFYESVDQRFLCCHIRKVLPLRKALRGLDAWATGLRRDQCASRTSLRKVELDHEHGGLVKISPLADWDSSRVWAYIRELQVPYHQLYDQGYTSIGCTPCTRRVAPGEDPRSGRWWWEKDAPKECGIHCTIESGGFRRQAELLLSGGEGS